MQKLLLKIKHSDVLRQHFGLFALAAIAVVVAVAPEHVQAATATAPVDPFASLLATLKGWITGSLGKLLATVALVVAGFAGATGSLRVAIVAFGLAMILAFGPDVIDAIFPAAA